MKAIALRAFGNYDTDSASLESALVCEDPSLAQQHQAEDADINVIVRRFGITGVIPQGFVVPQYADYPEVFDFRQAQEALRDASQRFMEVPAEIRGRFLNDPWKFMDFVSDPANIDEVVRLGLAVKKPEPEPEKVQKVEVVNVKESDSA